MATKTPLMSAEGCAISLTFDLWVYSLKDDAKLFKNPPRKKEPTADPPRVNQEKNLYFSYQENEHVLPLPNKT